MLSPYRVLDLTDERGILCGQLLADLGADVIQVEPPGGSPARRRGPFFNDQPHPDHSLYWWGYARNKRSVTLDYRVEAGRDLFIRLVRTADFLIESEAPSALSGCGLGYQDLVAVNPRLVYVSITPFGQQGPKATNAATDLTLLAASGVLGLTGDEDRAPVRVSVPQAYLHASVEAAVAALIAHHERQRSGLGQHVDVSAQQAVAQAAQGAFLAVPLGDQEIRRLGGGVRVGGLDVRMVWPAKDGHVAITFLFGSAIGPATRRLMEYIYEEGGCDEATRDKDWLRYTGLVRSGQEPPDAYRRVLQVVEDFTKTKTKRELLQAALERDLLVAPIASIDDVLASEQLAARDYWVVLELPLLEQPVRFPGPFARFSAAPIKYRRRPPRVGEHNWEIYVSELGCSEEELALLQAKEVI